MNVEGIVGAYRKADEDTRMSLFLAYRDLRGEFRRIDEELAEAEAAGQFDPQWLSWLWGPAPRPLGLGDDPSGD